MLSKKEIEAIRKRAEAASEGPWWASDGLYVVNNLTGDSYEWDADFVAETERESDADFIAHARTDIPKLSAEIERMRAGIMYAMQETYCDDTCDFLRRLLIGEEKTEIPYRMGHKYGGDSD